MKVQKVSQSITPFAGISFVNQEFNDSGLLSLIDTHLGIRTLSGYQYGEIFRAWFDIFFCGGEVAEDIQKYLRPTLENIPFNRVPSADTLHRVLKELATDNTTVSSVSDKDYQFNINENLNDLNIKSLLLTKQLNKNEFYDFDYDNQIIAHNKYDAKHTYKKTTGYFPGIATIADKIVYIENRDGNTNVKTGQAETLERAYQLLGNNGIKVNRSRMDAGSYSKEIIDTVAKNSKLFYIRANRCTAMTNQISEITNWKSIEINLMRWNQFFFLQFFQDRKYRLAVMREKNKDGQTNIFTGDNFIYRSILTNDWNSSEEDIIKYYNMRGASEKIFDVQNNDFGWSRLPSSDMNCNTVFLILTAMMKNFYNYLIDKVSEVFEDIPPTSRIKRFIFSFISVAGK